MAGTASGKELGEILPNAIHGAIEEAACLHSQRKGCRFENDLAAKVTASWSFRVAYFLLKWVTAHEMEKREHCRGAAIYTKTPGDGVSLMA